VALTDGNGLLRATERRFDGGVGVLAPGEMSCAPGGVHCVIGVDRTPHDLTILPALNGVLLLVTVAYAARVWSQRVRGPRSSLLSPKGGCGEQHGQGGSRSRAEPRSGREATLDGETGRARGSAQTEGAPKALEGSAEGEPNRGDPPGSLPQLREGVTWLPAGAPLGTIPLPVGVASGGAHGVRVEALDLASPARVLVGQEPVVLDLGVGLLVACVVGECHLGSPPLRPSDLAHGERSDGSQWAERRRSEHLVRDACFGSLMEGDCSPKVAKTGGG